MEKQITIWEWIEQIQKEFKEKKYDCFKADKVFKWEEFSNVDFKVDLETIDFVVINDLYLKVDYIEFDCRNNSCDVVPYVVMSLYKDDMFIGNKTIFQYELIRIEYETTFNGDIELKINIMEG